MKKTLLTLLALILGAAAAWADLPFRNHRYDTFKALDVNGESIVFVGNSITNMHEWWEAFGSAHVLNRGVSGAVTDEMLDNLESVLCGKPRKIFFMMGTNDLGTEGMNTPAYVARNVRTILRHCKAESPATELYMESILPSTVGLRTLENQKAANDSIRKICAEVGATYVDLWDDFTGIPNGVNSLDRLHLQPTGYRIWCKKVAQYVGLDCVYSDSQTNNAGGLGGAHGMRCSQFGFLPVKDGDILMIGDGTINGGEWHELLHSDKVKTRASGWGVPGADISTMSKMLPNIFNGRADNGKPAQVYIQLGYSEATGKTAAATIAQSYKSLVESIRTYAPDAAVYLCAVYPSNSASTNTSYIEPLNAELKALAEATSGVTYVPETYTSFLKNGVADPDCFTGVYLYGRGYARYAEVLARYMGSGVSPVTEAEAVERAATVNARQSLSDAIARAERISLGRGVGQYTAANAHALTEAISAAYAVLAKDNAAESELSAQATALSSALSALLPLINLPAASTDGDEHWYQLYTPNRGSWYTTAQGDGQTIVGAAQTQYARTMWKFVARTDGTYDIVNRLDGTYISPASSFNTAIKATSTRPASGWTLSHCNAAGLFNISSGTVQLNQTNSAQGYALYNWSSGGTGTDRNDTGCQFCIADAPDPVAEPDAFTHGDVTVSLATGTYANPSATFNKKWTLTEPTDPGLTLTCPANNMAANGDNIRIYSGTARTATYTLSVGSQYRITAYHFDFANISGNTSALTLTADGESLTTSQQTQTLSRTGLDRQSVTFTLSGDNKAVELQNFIVSIRHKDYATGIARPATLVPASEATASAPAYDLSGRRVSLPASGRHGGTVYIQGGKKMIR